MDSKLGGVTRRGVMKFVGHVAVAEGPFVTIPHSDDLSPRGGGVER